MSLYYRNYGANIMNLSDSLCDVREYKNHIQSYKNSAKCKRVFLRKSSKHHSAIKKPVSIIKSSIDKIKEYEEEISQKHSSLIKEQFYRNKADKHRKKINSINTSSTSDDEFKIVEQRQKRNLNRKPKKPKYVCAASTKNKLNSMSTQSSLATDTDNKQNFKKNSKNDDKDILLDLSIAIDGSNSERKIKDVKASLRFDSKVLSSFESDEINQTQFKDLDGIKRSIKKNKNQNNEIDQVVPSIDKQKISYERSSTDDRSSRRVSFSKAIELIKATPSNDSSIIAKKETNEQENESIKLSNASYRGRKSTKECNIQRNSSVEEQILNKKLINKKPPGSQLFKISSKASSKNDDFGLFSDVTSSGLKTIDNDNISEFENKNKESFKSIEVSEANHEFGELSFDNAVTDASESGSLINRNSLMSENNNTITSDINDVENKQDENENNKNEEKIEQMNQKGENVSKKEEDKGHEADNDNEDSKNENNSTENEEKAAKNNEHCEKIDHKESNQEQEVNEDEKNEENNGSEEDDGPDQE